MYRLRHLATDKISTYHVDLISPYISVEAHVQLEEPKAAEKDKKGKEPFSNPDFNPQPGAFLLFPNFGNVAYHLVQVTRGNQGDGEIMFRYWNTSDKLRLKRFRSVWDHPTDLEVQSMTKPKKNKKGEFTWKEHSANLEVFCQLEIPVTRNGKPGQGVHLAKPDVSRVLKYEAPESY